MKKRRASKDHGSVHLPKDVISEILIRLPVDSLARCMCVCKSWTRFLSEDIFAKRYLEMSKLRPGFIFKMWIPKQIKPDLFFYECNDGTLPGRTACYKLCGMMDDVTRVKGSCNGLVLLVRRTIDCICVVVNPLTRRYIALPRLELSGMDVQLWSLAHDHSTGVYKVFCGGNFSTGTDCYILTVGKRNSWRRVSFPDPFSPRNTHPVFANGAVHWICWKPSAYEGLDGCILSMDVNREVFQETRNPKCFARKCSLLEMDGLLCFVDILSRSELDLWVLTDMLQQHWEKRYRVELDLLAMGVRPGPSLRAIPLVILNGPQPSMVFAWPNRSNLFVYYFKKEKVEEMELKKSWFSQSMEVLDGPNGNVHLISHVSSFESWE